MKEMMIRMMRITMTVAVTFNVAAAADVDEGETLVILMRQPPFPCASPF